MEKVKGVDKNGVPVVYREFAEDYAKTMNAEHAVTVAYGNTIASKEMKAAALLKRPEVRAMVLEAMEANGATPQAAAKVIGEGLAAKKLVNAGEQMLEVEDHNVRLRAADMTMKMFGAYPKEKVKDGGGGSKHLHVYLQEPAPVRRFIVQHGRMPTAEEKAQLNG